MTDANNDRTPEQIDAELQAAVARLPVMRQQLAENIADMHNGAPDAMKRSRALSKEADALNRQVRQLTREAAAVRTRPGKR